MSRLPAIANPQRQPYPSDMSDSEWEILKPLVPLPKGFGHPIEVDFREIFNAIFHVQRICDRTIESGLTRRSRHWQVPHLCDTIAVVEA